MAAAAFRRSWAAACSTVRSLRVGDPDAMAEGLRCQEGWSSPWLACAVRCLPCQQPHSRSERSLRPLAGHAVSAPPPPQVRGGAPSPSASSCDRECPLGTAGDRCLWHVGGTRPVGTMWFAPVGEGSPLAGRCGSPRVDEGLVGKLRSGAAASGRPDHGQSSRLLSCPRWAPPTTTPGSDNRERRGDQPSQRSLIFRGATGPDRHPSPTREDAPHQYVQPTLLSFRPRIINPLGLRDKWD